MEDAEIRTLVQIPSMNMGEQETPAPIKFRLDVAVINSSIEGLAGHLHLSQHPSLKVAKDMAAGAVLLASLAAAIIGALLVLSVL